MANSEILQKKSFPSYLKLLPVVEHRPNPRSLYETERIEIEQKMDTLLTSFYSLSLSLFENNAVEPEQESVEFLIPMPDFPFYMLHRYKEHMSPWFFPNDAAHISLKKSSLEGLSQRKDFMHMTVRKPSHEGFFVFSEDKGRMHLPYAEVENDNSRLKEKINQIQGLYTLLEKEL